MEVTTGVELQERAPWRTCGRLWVHQATLGLERADHSTETGVVTEIVKATGIANVRETGMRRTGIGDGVVGDGVAEFVEEHRV